MANFRTTADYLDSILLLAGETTNGNSAFETRALHYINQIHNAILGGGNEFNKDVDELWNWALTDTPTIIELKPVYETGTVSLTNGSVDGTLSTAPSISLKGYHFKLKNSTINEVYKVVSHSAGNTAFTIDSEYASATESTLNYEMFLLDYELIPSVIAIDEYNNKMTFTETTAGTELVATLVQGSYTIADLLTELDTRMDAAGASAYTSSYDAVTRKFTILSDLAGGDNICSLTAGTGTNSINYASVLPTLGLGIKDHTGAASYTSERALGAINQLVEPLEMHTGYTDSHKIYGVEKVRFSSDYAIGQAYEGSPDRFTVVEEREDGYIKIRFNKYVKEARRVEVTYVPIPLDLYDTANSHPIIPRKYARLVDYGGAAYLMAEKNDARAQQYFGLAGQLLEAMMLNNRKTGERVGLNYGEIVARPDLLAHYHRRLRYGYTDGEN